MNPEGLADFVGRSRLCRPKSEGKPHMLIKIYFKVFSFAELNAIDGSVVLV